MENALTFLINNPDVANALATVFAAITALVALFVSVWALRVQRRHNKVSVRPIPEVTVADYENSLRVKLRNNGVGPMIVKRLRVTKDAEEKESVIAWMPSLPPERPWTHFALVLSERTLQTDGVIPLLELTQYDGETSFHELRDLVRAALCKLTVAVEYTDAYGTKFQTYSKSLEWFGRNLRQDA